ncbi:MAG: MoaD/ThiS family protein [Pseudomonadota bacterium]
MAIVVFTANLKRHVDCPQTDAQGDTVAEVLNEVFAQNETLRGYVLDEQGGLRKHMGIIVDGTVIADRTTLSDPVGTNSQIYVLQALSGG